jgi:hypothetical protein
MGLLPKKNAIIGLLDYTSGDGPEFKFVFDKLTLKRNAFKDSIPLS